MPFSSLHPLRTNARALPRTLGVLRLVAMVATIATALQWIVPAGARLIFNAGRVYYSNEPFSLWGEVLPWPVLSVPAWMTISTVTIACVAAFLYLLLGGTQVRKDVPFTVIVVGGFAVLFPLAIATFDPDPTGVISTPGPDGYPIGWHWLASPLSLLVVLGAILGRNRRPLPSGETRGARVAS
ncbi:hypothetical protein ACWIBQ_07610 [Microbacterium keratanolyticum]